MLKKLLGKLPIATKITFITWSFIWTFAAIFGETEDGTKYTFAQWAIVWIFGSILVSGIATFIAFVCKDEIKRMLPSIFTSPEKTIVESNPAEEPKVEVKSYDAMEGHEFEYYCADLLKKNNYENVEVTKGSGDQGIDIIAYKDGIKYGIQCKCYSSDIGNKAVQEAYSGKDFYNCHVAAVLTNRFFTTSAKQLASKNNVLLWDRDRLNDFIKRTESFKVETH